MKEKKWIKGLSVSLTFLGSLFIGLELIATSSPTYKNMVDGIFGINYSSNTSKDLATYSYLSDFDNTKDLLNKRKEVASSLEEEGVVLLKNDNNSLPLLEGDNDIANVTVLGSRAFTFKENATRKELRDTYHDGREWRQLNVYAGICGSRTYQERVSLPTGEVDLPITLLDALEQENIRVNPQSEKVYRNKSFPMYPKGSELNGEAGGPFAVREPSVSVSEFGDLGVYRDAAIVMIGRMSGEGMDYLPGQAGIEDATDGSKSALNLSNDERNLIVEAKKISNNVVVLINSAIPMEIDELKDDPNVSSILWIGLPGLYGMEGVAKVLSGKSNPSGSLVDVYAVDSSASPAAINFGVNSQEGDAFTWSNPGDIKGGDGKVKAYNGHYIVLAEGIYDGYYYYETRYNDTIEDRGNASSGVGAGRNKEGDTWKYENEVSYTFGYGKSYTEFEVTKVGEPTLNSEDLSLSFKYNVKNIGSRAGKKSVQLYMSSPYTDYDISHKIEKSAIQLVGFEKTRLLEPNEEQELTINVPLKYIASYDVSASHDQVNGGYILEAANYYFSTGNGAHEALNNALVKKDALNANKIYKEFNVEADTSVVSIYNPSNDVDLTSLDRGTFTDGINATLLNKKEDGTLIKNQLQNADYNFYKANTVTYLSRNDYQNTFPVPYPNLEITSDMEIYLGKGKDNGGHVYQFQTGKSDELWGVDHQLEEDDEGNPYDNEVLANYKNALFNDEKWDYLLEQIKLDEAYLFGPNGGANCNAFTSINAPEVWQADGPNGNLSNTLGARANTTGPMSMKKDDPNASYKSCDMPCEPIIAATFNKELVEEEGESFGDLSLFDHYPILWAPGMNLHRTPFNSRNHEYYSEDPMLTNLIGRAFVSGGLKKGAILSAKHFAFNTQESFREGLSQFMNEQAARELELRGFEGVISDCNVTTPGDTKVNALGLMTSFSRIGCTGVNAHSGLMKGILRGEWGFKGLISTDFVATGKFFNPQDCAVNNVTFMACGNASGLLNSDWVEYKNKAKDDPNLLKNLKLNMHYYLYAIANSNVLNGYDSTTKAISSSDIVSPWQIGFIAGGIGALVLSAGAFGLYVFLHYKKKKELNVKEGL